MSLIETVASTILKFKVDVTDAKRGLRELAGEEKKAAEASIAAAEVRNSSMEKVQKALEKTAAGLQIFKAGIEFTGDAWKAYEKAANEAGGAEAARAKSFRAALDNYNKGMNDLQVAIGKMVVSFGPLISVIGEVASGVASIVSAIPSEILGVLAAAGGTAYGARRLGGGRGGRISQAIPLIGTGVVLGTEAGNFIGEQYQESLLGGVRDQRLAQANLTLKATQTEGIATANAALERSATAQVASLVRNIATLEKILGVNKKRKRGGGGARVDNSVSYDTESQTGGIEYVDMTLGAAGTDYGTGAGPARYGMDQFDYGAFGRDAAASLDAFRKQTMLEQIFGAPEAFDAYQAKLELLKTGLDVFTGALQSHFDAWVQGSETLSQAIGQLGRDVVTGLASQLQAYAIQQGVLAIVSLAEGIGGSPRGFAAAAAHGKAAAAAEAGAIAVGALARHFNTGGGGGSGGGGGGGYSGAPAAGSYGNIGGGSGFGGGDGKTTVVYVGDYWVDNPRQHRQRVGAAVRSAGRELSGSYQVRDE